MSNFGGPAKATPPRHIVVELKQGLLDRILMKKKEVLIRKDTAPNVRGEHWLLSNVEF
jgi:hypothetical protein